MLGHGQGLQGAEKPCAAACTRGPEPAGAAQVKKPLRISFFSNGVMEEGIDQGGVKKEFFQIVTRALFNEVCPPPAGMWDG